MVVIGLIVFIILFIIITRDEFFDSLFKSSETEFIMNDDLKSLVKRNKYKATYPEFKYSREEVKNCVGKVCKEYELTGIPQEYPIDKVTEETMYVWMDNGLGSYQEFLVGWDEITKTMVGMRIGDVENYDKNQLRYERLKDILNNDVVVTLN